MIIVNLLSRSRQVIALLLSLATIAAPNFGHAEFVDPVVNANGLIIYAGVVPAAVVKLHPQSHAEATMHGGAPRGSNSFHYIIAIFDAKTGARVEEAEITATVSLPGHLESQSLRFDAMTIAGTVTYGAFVAYKSAGRHELVLNIKMRGAGEVIHAKFVDEYRAIRN